MQANQGLRSRILRTYLALTLGLLGAVSSVPSEVKAQSPHEQWSCVADAQGCQVCRTVTVVDGQRWVRSWNTGSCQVLPPHLDLSLPLPPVGSSSATHFEEGYRGWASTDGLNQYEFWNQSLDNGPPAPSSEIAALGATLVAQSLESFLQAQNTSVQDALDGVRHQVGVDAEKKQTTASQNEALLKSEGGFTREHSRAHGRTETAIQELRQQHERASGNLPSPVSGVPAALEAELRGLQSSARAEGAAGKSNSCQKTLIQIENEKARAHRIEDATLRARALRSLEHAARFGCATAQDAGADSPQAALIQAAKIARSGNLDSSRDSTETRSQAEAVRQRVEQFQSQDQALSDRVTSARTQVSGSPQKWRAESVELAHTVQEQSREEFWSGNLVEGEAFQQGAFILVDVALSLTPGVSVGKDFYELVHGKNLVTGEPLSGLDRSFAALGVVTLGTSNLTIKGPLKIAQGTVKIAQKVERLRGIENAVPAVERALNAAEPLARQARFLRERGLSDEASRGLSKLLAHDRADVIEPLLRHSPEASEQLGRVLLRAEKFEVKTAAEANKEFIEDSLKVGKRVLPPHHPDLPVIEVTRAQPGTKVYSAHSPVVDPNRKDGFQWLSMEDPRLGTKAEYSAKMAILPSFGNTLEKVWWIDVSERRFTLSFANPLGDLPGGGLQGMFKEGEIPLMTEWSTPVDWLE